MNFWRNKHGSAQHQHATASRKGGGDGSSSAHTNLPSSNGIATSNRPLSIIRPSPNVSGSTLPSRRQRMQLLKRIIHHADKVQNEYLVSKNNAVDPNNAPKNSILIRRDVGVEEINEKCFKRWHQVLQEGLVPMSVVALNLLQKSTSSGEIVDMCDDDKEEEAYFASLEGMEEEIQVMAILGRAAALNDGAGANVDSKKGIENIHATMKCIAMLLFHIVLDASSMGPCETPKTNIADSSKSRSCEARKSIAGYDGRIRHVVKLASVDVLSQSIIESVNNYSLEGGYSSDAIHNMNDYSSWDLSSLAAFLDQTDLGKDAIFGTMFQFKPTTESVLESGNSPDDVKKYHKQKQEDLTQTCSESNDHAKTTDGVSLNNESNSVNSASSSLSDGDGELRNNQNIKNGNGDDQEQCPDEGVHCFEDKDPQVRRLFNAKFLATRKFELIERLVAIEIVRFFMAEEREMKICQKKLNKKSVPLSEGDAINQDGCSEQDKTTSSQLFSAHQIKRGAKIVGAGVALGTVFAITGGLAAPALAAAIGGITALTGATTATSTALLALLATFKAGAALFGVGGGGLAAYKMNKRTAGLSDFEIRRENIEQYMYLGAPDEKMKLGIEAMLPQLHTTVCVSGWLRDRDTADFQLAWGVQPTCKYDKSEEDIVRIRQMKRFYSIYNPPLVHSCEAFMQVLQSKLKKNFSWDRQVTRGIIIWHQIENKYGANPDHMIPLSSSITYLSRGEKELIDGVLNDVKIASLKKRGLSGISCNDNDEIDDLLAKSSPTRNTKKNLDLDPIKNEFDIKSDLHLSERDDKTDKKLDSTMVTTSMPSEQNDGALHHYRHAPSSIVDPQMHSQDEDYDNESRPVVWDWTRLYGTADIHTVTWESKMLSSLCHIVEKMAFEISGQATRVALQFSVLGAVLSAIMIPSALATATKFIDDPYQIVVIRADAAGKELAKCLLQSDEKRPVTLIGFSFGARVIYACLRELARQQDIWENSRTSKQNCVADEMKCDQTPLSDSGDDEHLFKYDREPASLVADVIFIGLPRAIDEQVLTSCRRVTGGRFVHCYTRNDWFLTLMFIARAGTPCGIKPISNVPGVENYDVTEFVEAHTKYADAIPRILQHIRFAEP